jgi:hypothetical protein
VIMVSPVPLIFCHFRRLSRVEDTSRADHFELWAVDIQIFSGFEGALENQLRACVAKAHGNNWPGSPIK